MAQPRVLRRLDRKRAFGTVHGGDPGYAYEQDKLRFDHQGVEIPHDPNEAVVRPDPNAPEGPAPAGDDMVEVEIAGVTVRVKASDLPKIAPAMAASAGPAAPPAVREAAGTAAEAAVEGAGSVDDMKGTDLRALYRDLTGKGFRVGTTLPQMRALVNEAIAVAETTRKAA
jgi:hypothetical protein